MAEVISLPDETSWDKTIPIIIQDSYSKKKNYIEFQDFFRDYSRTFFIFQGLDFIAQSI